MKLVLPLLRRTTHGNLQQKLDWKTSNLLRSLLIMWHGDFTHQLEIWRQALCMEFDFYQSCIHFMEKGSCFQPFRGIWVERCSQKGPLFSDIQVFVLLCPGADPDHGADPGCGLFCFTSVQRERLRTWNPALCVNHMHYAVAKTAQSQRHLGSVRLCSLPFYFDVMLLSPAWLIHSEDSSFHVLGLSELRFRSLLMFQNKHKALSYRV